MNILDKFIIDRHAPNVYVYAAWIGVLELVIGVVSLVVVVGVQGVSASSFGGGAAIGAVSATGLMFLLAALKYGQVNRVVPIWFTYPLLVAPIAAVFLDEQLSAIALGAILLAVVGAILVSWEGESARGRFGHPAALLLALGASAGWALSFILSKHFLEGGHFWQVFASYRLGFSAVMLMGVGSRRVRTSSMRLVRDATFVKLILLAELVITVVVITRFAAVSLGPDVSIIAAISAVQPALVYLYSLVLAGVSPLMFGSWVNRGTFFTQSGGILAITAAVVIISLKGEG